jgi:perosamine synthetase
VIPVSEPWLGEEERDAVLQALERGEISGTFGESIPLFEAEFAEYCGSRYGVATTSGTTALQLAVAAAGIGPGDEVLISASTNIATALAVVHNGAVPVPVDSEPVTWNLDLDLLESLITPRTVAVIPVHLYGHPVDMDRLLEITRRHQLLVIEDAAEAHGAECRGRKAGSFGELGCFSFYANKIITTGEGGMVVTNDQKLFDRLRLIRNLGFTTPRFRHEVLGHNFRMTGLQAAMGRAQLGKIEKIIAEKRRVAMSYRQLLTDVRGLTLPTELNWARNVYWMYGVVTEGDRGRRDRIMAELERNGIETRTFFCPMSLQPCLRALSGFDSPPTPVAETLWRQGFYLPSSPLLTNSQLEEVATVLRQALAE